MTLHGLLLTDKGPGVTSFQVVAHLRRTLGVGKIGHGGTLDPMATGLLPILIGEATKLTAYVQGQDKEYLATVRLGVTTDTLDATGQVMRERPVPPLSAHDLRAVLDRFVGEIAQVPPMFSALHAGGRRLHELARAGIEVERPPRRVRIHSLEVVEWAPPDLRLRVACSSGTYVRSLAADVGEALGCGGHVAALVRTRVGAFSLDEAVPWARVQHGTAAELAAHVLPADRAVAHLPSARVTREDGERLAHGQEVPVGAVVADAEPGAPRPCRAYANGAFLGVGELSSRGLRPLRLLHADRPGARPVSG
jgi:tRNA pseudouridine55 synthase